MEPMTKFTFIIKGDKWWTLTQKFYDELKKAYPQHDVDAELRKMVLWCRKNTRKRKSAGGMSRFILGWMNRSEEVGYVSERLDSKCMICKNYGDTKVVLVRKWGYRKNVCLACIREGKHNEK